MYLTNPLFCCPEIRGIGFGSGQTPFFTTNKFWLLFHQCMWIITKLDETKGWIQQFRYLFRFLFFEKKKISQQFKTSFYKPNLPTYGFFDTVKFFYIKKTAVAVTYYILRFLSSLAPSWTASEWIISILINSILSSFLLHFSVLTTKLRYQWLHSLLHVKCLVFEELAVFFHALEIAVRDSDRDYEAHHVARVLARKSSDVTATLDQRWKLLWELIHLVLHVAYWGLHRLKTSDKWHFSMLLPHFHFYSALCETKSEYYSNFSLFFPLFYSALFFRKERL